MVHHSSPQGGEMWLKSALAPIELLQFTSLQLSGEAGSEKHLIGLHACGRQKVCLIAVQVFLSFTNTFYEWVHKINLYFLFIKFRFRKCFICFAWLVKFVVHVCNIPVEFELYSCKL